jgi:predicted HTH transcriptional regulator
LQGKEIFNLKRFMEESGVGMDTYRTMRKTYDLPVPIISYKKPNLIVTFPRTMEASKEAYSNKGISLLNNEELIGYEVIKKRGKLLERVTKRNLALKQKKQKDICVKWLMKT